MNPAAVNLNLLPVLDALLRERSVSRAGHRLGLSQPAVSNALAQLRQLFGDPLLLRGKKGVHRGTHAVTPLAGMVPTARALGLEEPVRAALMALAQCLTDPAPFEPATAQHTFVVAMSDFVAFAILPSLLARLARSAPGVRLEVHASQELSVPPELARGEVDLALGFRRSLPPQHFDEAVFEDRFACVLRRGHPRLRKGRLSLDDYLALGHVLVSSQRNGRGLVDSVLAKRGLSRRLAVQVSHFLLVPAIVASTDYVAALSERVAQPFAARWPLVVVPPPLPLPASNVFMMWHARTAASPAHAWLRAEIGAAGRVSPASRPAPRTSGRGPRRSTPGAAGPRRRVRAAPASKASR